METLAKVAFAFYTLVILGGGIMAVSAQSLVRALVGLMATLFAVAGMYLLLASPLMAFMQLLIYVGAVTVLIFLAVMLTRADNSGDETKPKQTRQYLFALLGFMAPAAILSWIIAKLPPSSLPVPVPLDPERIGEAFLGPFALAFELISVVLLVAMMGAVLMTWERRGSK